MSHLIKGENEGYVWVFRLSGLQFVSAVAVEGIIKEPLGYGHMSLLPFIGPTSIHDGGGLLGPPSHSFSLHCLTN